MPHKIFLFLHNELNRSGTNTGFRQNKKKLNVENRQREVDGRS